MGTSSVRDSKQVEGSGTLKSLHGWCAAALAVFVLLATPGLATAQTNEPVPAVHDDDLDTGSFHLVFDLVRATRSAVGQMFETVGVAYQLVVGMGDGPIAFTPQGLKLLVRTYGGIWSFWDSLASGPVSVGDVLAEIAVLTDRVAYILDNELVPRELPGGVEVAETPSPSPTPSDGSTPDQTPVPSPTGSPPADPTSEPEPVVSP